MAEASRVWIVCGSTGPLGELVHAQRLAEHLPAEGFEVDVWALAGHEETLPRPGASAVRVVPASTSLGVERRARVLGAALAGAGPPGVLIAEDVVSGLACVRVREIRAGVRVVRTIHHLEPAHDPVIHEAQRVSVEAADARVSVSRYWSERAAGELGVGVAVVANGVDYARFAAPDLGRREARAAHSWGPRTVVLSVGGIGARKGSTTLIEAFARARGRMGEAPLLVIVGGAAPPAGYLDRFLEEAGRLGLSVDRGTAAPTTDVVLLPTQAERAMPVLYRAADVFALPSTREGFGLAALEAAASGLPIVLSDLAVFRERFSHGRDCLMVPVGDSGPLAEALVRGARETELRRSLGDAAQRTAERHDWAAAAAGYAAIIRGE